jgi:hypothetical protein
MLKMLRTRQLRGKRGRGDEKTHRMIVNVVMSSETLTPFFNFSLGTALLQPTT